jgi:hypothetical protein
LKAEQADGIGIGSPVLYLGLEAGKVKALRAAKEGGDRTRDRRCLCPCWSSSRNSGKSRRWIPGCGWMACRSRWNLATLLRGAIEFDRLGTGRSSHQLFDSKEQAKAKVRTLSLVADSNPGLGSAAHPLPRGRHRQD